LTTITVSNSILILLRHCQKISEKNLNGSLILGQNYFVNQSKEQFTQGSNLALPDFFDMANAFFLFCSRENRHKKDERLVRAGPTGVQEFVVPHIIRP